jgi:drug/metabolite transporter (DMT)-like permease
MSAVSFALLAVVANVGTGILSKGLATRYPARPLIGVLMLMNCLLLLPLAPFVEWRWSAGIVALHLISAALLVISSVAVWDMLDAGAASATATAEALSPIAAAVGAAILLPGSTSLAQSLAALAVAAGVSWTIRDAFKGLGRRGTTVRIILAATGTGLLTVATRLLADEGVGVVETYVVRTALAAAVLLLAIPPRGIPLSGGPRLLLRSVVVTTSFVFIILAVQQGSPVTVQTLLAFTPLLILGYESLQARSWPPKRSVVGASLAVLGVIIVVAGAR